MNQFFLSCRLPACLAILAAAFVVTPGLLAQAPAVQQPPRAQPAGEVQDFVFLAEARPILVRLRVQVDGAPVQAGYAAFLKHLFAYLDVDGNGVLNKAEAERIPPLDQILSGMPVSGIAAFGGGGGPAGPTFADIDTNKDGKVNLAELTAYYRGKGFTPFQTEFDAKQGNQFAMLGGGGPSRPTPAAIGEAVFNLLDTDKDGKLTAAELAVAADVLLRKDENEDDLVTPRELVPNKGGQKAKGGGGMMAFGLGQAKTPENPYVVLVDAKRHAPNLVSHFQKRYGAGIAPDQLKLSRKTLGLDDKAFAALDANGDGVVDAKELAGFVKRTPDVELVLRLGTLELNEQRVQMLAGTGVSFKARDHLALFDLGATRLELRGYEHERTDRLGGIVRTQFLAQFQQAAKGGKGDLNAKQAEASPLFRSVFKAMDRDGDGKVTEQEFVAYLDKLEDLKRRARAACVTLVVEDQSRGLFDLLDTNRDGHLSLRELRGADRLLLELGCVRKGFLTKADLPRSYLLKLRRGSAKQGGFDLSEVFEQLYQGSYEESGGDYATAGPMWFRKMDRNRDGDVSRKEFLGTDDQFREIDADGDGLISAAEAERYDALCRKKQ